MGEVGDLLSKRSLYKDLVQIVNANPTTRRPDYFVAWLQENYAIALSLGVRRMIDTDHRSISLGRLLYELIESPRTITREAHRVLYIALPELADGTFDRCVGEGRQFLPQSAARSDLRALEGASARVHRLVNKRYAHSSQLSAIRRMPTFEELHSALDLVDETLAKYHVLLLAESFQTAEPEPQYEWTDALRTPWLPSETRFVRRSLSRRGAGKESSDRSEQASRGSSCRYQ